MQKQRPTVFHWQKVSKGSEEVGMIIESARETSLMDFLAGTVSNLCVVFILFAALTAWLEFGDLSLWLFVHSG